MMPPDSKSANSCTMVAPKIIRRGCWGRRKQEMFSRWCQTELIGRVATRKMSIHLHFCVALTDVLPVGTSLPHL